MYLRMSNRVFLLSRYGNKSWNELAFFLQKCCPHVFEQRLEQSQEMEGQTVFIIRQRQSELDTLPEYPYRQTDSVNFIDMD